MLPEDQDPDAPEQTEGITKDTKEGEAPMPKMPASHDPAQPKGQPEPGDPRIQAKIDSGELPPPEEEEAPPPEEELDHDGQVQKLVDDNTREALIELADKEDVNIGSGDTKSDIAEAIVCKREEEKGE